MMKTSGSRLLRQIYILIIPTILVLSLMVAGYQYYLQLNKSKMEFVSTLQKLAGTVALTIPGESVQLIKTPGDFASGFYRDIQSRLSEISGQFKLDNGFIKILRKKEMNTEIIVSDQNVNTIGQSFDFWTEMEPAFDGNLSGKLIIRDGTDFAIGMAPIYSLDQNTIAILLVESEIIYSGPSFLKILAGPIVSAIILIIIILLVTILQSRKLNHVIMLFKDNLNRLKTGQELEPGETDTYLSEITPELSGLEEELKGFQENQQDRAKIQRQITGLLRTVNAAADGDFTIKAEVTANTLGALADSFNLMVSDLSELVKDAKSAAEQVSTSTQNIFKNVEVMSQGAVDQASKTEDISNSAKEMANLITGTNQNAQRASEAAQNAKKVAENGSEIIKKSIAGMQIINSSVNEAARQVGILREHSTRIGEITDFIGELSSRTNLLALNTSIESARAGEAGRGFSIVAEEIRDLAERASKSADEISDLIDDIQRGISKTVRAIDKGAKEVSQGTDLVDRAGEALREILGSVDISTKSAIDISNATREQAKFSQDIVNSLEHIAGIAKETAENTQHSREAASNLEALSKTLNLAVEKFRLAQ